MRVVFGAELPALRDRDPAHARHDDVAAARALFFSLTGDDLGSGERSREVEAQLDEVIRGRRRRPPAIVDELHRGRCHEAELRDQLVTSSPPGHETTAVRSPGRSAARPPPAGPAPPARGRAGLGATRSSRSLRARPVPRSPRASSSRRSRWLAGAAGGVHVAPCTTSRTAATSLADPTLPPRALARRRGPDSYGWTPVRRRRAPLRRRRVRLDGDERGPARGRSAVSSSARPRPRASACAAAR